MGTVSKIESSVGFDVKTGEVVLDEKVYTTVKTEQADLYFKAFTDDLASLYGTTHAAKKVLLAILTKEVNRRGELAMSLYIKQQMAKEIGFKNTKSIDNGINNLIKNNILVRVARGTFKLNPHIFAKGTPKEINAERVEYLKLTIIYSQKGRQLVAEVKEKSEGYEETKEVIISQ